MTVINSVVVISLVQFSSIRIVLLVIASIGDEKLNEVRVHGT